MSRMVEFIKNLFRKKKPVVQVKKDKTLQEILDNSEFARTVKVYASNREAINEYLNSLKEKELLTTFVVLEALSKDIHSLEGVDNVNITLMVSFSTVIFMNNYSKYFKGKDYDERLETDKYNALRYIFKKEIVTDNKSRYELAYVYTDDQVDDDNKQVLIYANLIK